MARLSGDVVQKREEFIYNLFKSQPETTMEMANAELASKLGGPKMNSRRIYEIRKLATNNEPLNTKGVTKAKAKEAEAKEAVLAVIQNHTKEPTPVIKAARGPTPKATPRGVGMGFGDEAQALEAATRALQSIGASNIKITYQLTRSFDR